MPKLEAAVQASGEARYTNDEPMSTAGSSMKAGLHAALVYSQQASGSIASIDARAALAMPGVAHFYSAADISRLARGTGGHNDCGAFPGDEEVFASTQVYTCGQSVGVVLADSQERANAAAKAVVVNFAPNAPAPLVDLNAAVAAKSFFPDNAFQQNTPPIVRGDVDAGFKASAHVVSGSLFSGGQYHFSMETQSSYASPAEDGTLDVWNSSQGTADVRAMLAHVLNVPANKVVVRTKRAGGGFGGKLSRNHPLAAAVAVAAVLSGRPVKGQASRFTDMSMFGKRPQMRIDYKVGFNADGSVQALQLFFYQQGGAWYEANMGTMQMCLFWSDNCSYVPNFSATGYVARCATPANTSMRGPGVMKSVFAAQAVLDRVAWELGMDAAAVQQRNFYTEGQLTPYGEPVTQTDHLAACWKLVQTQANYPALKDSVAAFNKANRWRKRGVRLSTVKYGMNNGQEAASCSGQRDV